MGSVKKDRLSVEKVGRDYHDFYFLASTLLVN